MKIIKRYVDSSNLENISWMLIPSAMFWHQNIFKFHYWFFRNIKIVLKYFRNISDIFQKHQIYKFLCKIWQRKKSIIFQVKGIKAEALPTNGWRRFCTRLKAVKKSNLNNLNLPIDFRKKFPFYRVLRALLNGINWFWKYLIVSEK